MGDLSNILRELSNLTIKKIIVLIISSAFLVAIWKFDVLIDTALKIKGSQKVENKPETQKQEIKFIFNASSNSGISETNLLQIKAYLSEYLQKYPKSVYSISVFKFLPPGHEYAYQGRLLVAFKSKFLEPEEESKFLKELNANWIPMWSGKQSMEFIIDGKYISLNYDDKDQSFKIKDDLDHIPNSNFTILGELGIKSIFRFPIITNDQTVGYLSLYLTEDITQDLENDLKRISTFLSNRLSGYLLNKGETNAK